MEKRNNPIIEKLNEMIHSDIFKGKKVVLFGANKSSKQMKEFLEKNQISVNAIVDNDKRKWSKAPFGVMTYAPEEYLEEFCDEYIILIVSQYYAEMTAQLEKMGYELNKHIYIVQKLFRKYDTSEDAFLYFEKQIYFGYNVYNRIVHKYSNVFERENGKLFICPYVGNGDIYLIGKFLSRYCENNEIHTYIITVIGNVCKKIGQMFQWSNIEVLTQEESDAMIAYVRFQGLQKCHAEVMNDCYQQVVNRRFRGYKALDFRHMFQLLVFDLKQSDYLDINEKEIELEEISRYAETIGLVEHKSVIVAPYANTISTVSNEVWEKIIYYYKKNGYEVFTNAAGEQETALPDTKVICPPFAYMKKLVEYAGVFIGVRSGLCDIIAGAKAKKIILYPEGMLFGSCSTYDYFSLNCMGLCNDAIEIEYGQQSSDVLIDSIKNGIV